MSGLAKVARILGAEVTGSDRSLEGHAAENVPAGAEVVYSSAIPPDNPERTTGAPELHRADLLAELTQLKPTIAVSGTHGKTTTTSMLVHALPGQSYLVGGEVRSTGTNADWTDGEWLIVEADESDRSLLKLHPTIAVVTNAELDHHTEYASSRDVDDTFREFLARARDAVVAPDLIRLRADAHVFGEYDGPLPVPGAHNRRNAAAALKAIELAGGDVQAAAGRLATFAGAGRRFEIVGHGQRRDGRRRLRPPPDRGPRHDRGRAHPGRQPGHRALPAAPVQPHAAGGEGVRRRRSRRPTWSCRSTCTRPASARRTTPAITGLLIAQHTADARRGVPVDLGEDARHRPRLSATDVAGRRPPAHDGRRRREHDRQGPGRA